MITAAAILLLALSSGPAVSCNEKTQGQMWPAEATVSRTAMRRSVECGQLYVCERGNWRRQLRQV